MFIHLEIISKPWHPWLGNRHWLTIRQHLWQQALGSRVLGIRNSHRMIERNMFDSWLKPHNCLLWQSWGESESPPRDYPIICTNSLKQTWGKVSAATLPRFHCLRDELNSAKALAPLFWRGSPSFFFDPRPSLTINLRKIVSMFVDSYDARW